MKKRRLSFLLALAGVALVSPRVLGRTTKGPSTPTLVIRGGHLFDAEQGTRHELGQLWIAGERVLGEHALDAEVPEGVPVIEAKGMTLVPGLFDLHCHISVPGGPMSQRLEVTARQNLASHLYSGVTHAVDLHGDESTIFALRDESRPAPDLARLYVAGGAFTAPGGHATQFGTPANVVTSPEEVAQRFAGLLPKGPDVIKGIQEHGGWSLIPKLPTLSSEVLCAVAEHARAAKLPFFCHVWNLAEAHAAVQCGADALAHGVFLDDVDDGLLTAMGAAGTAYIPTLAVVFGARRAASGASPYDRESLRGAMPDALMSALTDPGLADDPMATWATSFDADGQERAFRNLARVFEAGIRVGLGTDAGNPLTPHGPAAIHEMELYVEAGLSPADVLGCATIQSARILAVDEDFGTLSAGKVADVVLVRGDPTADIARMWEVEHVLKAGAVVDRASMRLANAPVPQGERRVVREDGLQVDDFADGDLASEWGAQWSVLTDSVAGGASEGALAAEVEEDLAFLRLTGSVKKGFQWGAWSGVVLDWSAGGAGPVDASARTGLRLRVRGTARPYTLTILRDAVKDYNVFSIPISIGPEWAEITIPFATLKQIGFGKPLPWAADDLTGLALDARNNPMQGISAFGDFELDLDWIRLY